MSDIRKIYLALLTAIVVLFAGCGHKPAKNLKYGKYFDFEEAVDLSDVVKINEKAVEAEKNGTRYDALSALLGMKFNPYNKVFSDNSSAIRLPQYAKSNQPFLSKAEVFYNSCRYMFDVWTDYEQWLLSYNGEEITSEDELMAGISKNSDDAYAMNCAASIGGMCSLERFGRYLFGGPG